MDGGRWTMDDEPKPVIIHRLSYIVVAQRFLHALQRCHQRGAGATQVDAHETIAAGAKRGAIVKRHFCIFEEELIRIARNAHLAAIQKTQIG